MREVKQINCVIKIEVFMDVLCKSMFLENLIPIKLMIAVFLIKQHTVVFFFYDLLF